MSLNQRFPACQKTFANALHKSALAAIAVASIFSSMTASAGLLYMNPNAANYTSLPAPPTPGSQAAAEDLQQVLDLQKTRTAAQCAQAQHERSLQLGAIFGQPLGPLTATEVQSGLKLYNQIKNETDYFVGSIKNHWNRKRPYLESNAVKPCVPLEPSSSYPSGHATISREEALVFGLIYPEKAEALIGRANEVALDRVIGGVHHPIDIQMGQELADILFAKMKQNPKFQADINAYKQMQGAQK